MVKDTSSSVKRASTNIYPIQEPRVRRREEVL